MIEFNGFTEKASNALNNSVRTASIMGHTYVGSEHILCGLLSGGGMAEHILSSQGIKRDAVISKIERMIGRGIPTQLGICDFTPRSKKIMESALYQAKKENTELAGTEHILYAMLADQECSGCVFLKEMGADIASGIKDCSNGKSYSDSREEHFFARRRLKGDSVLAKYGRDLTLLAECKEIDPVFCRESEMQRIIQVLLRRRKNNPCLIGDSGVGKTAIVEGLALKIAENAVPDALRHKRLFMLDITSMIAGAKYRGDFEERIKSAVDEVVEDRNTIIFIDEIHNIVGAGSAEGAIDAANILKPLLARSEIQVIGATTVDEYRRFIEKDSALERRFQPIMIEEPDTQTAVKILSGLKSKYETHHNVQISDEAIKEAVDLSVKYIYDRKLPDKAIDIIDEAASAQRMKFFSGDPKSDIVKMSVEEKVCWKESRCIVDKASVAQVVSYWSGIPVGRLSTDRIAALDNLENDLKREIIGQDKAVEAVVKAVKRGQIGLKERDRPICSMLFLGPTGVGKTKLCKCLAKVLFGNEKSLIRLDMSEFKEKHSVSKLIGSPPGYVGFENGGKFIEAVRKKPYSVILLDEIEKAHPDVFDLLLQILEDGILTSSDGKKAVFSNTIIIMTGNIGAEKITDNKISMGFNPENEDERSDRLVTEMLKKRFKPEFLNRIDETVIFRSLDIASAESVCKIMLDELCERALDTGLFISYTDDTVKGLTQIGYSKAYGARQIRRTIVSEVEDKLAQCLLDGTLKYGDNVLIDYNNEIKIILKELCEK